VAIDVDLVIAFNENVRLASGSLVIKRTSDGSTVETISVPGSQVSIAGAVATVDLAANLTEDTDYYVEVAGGTFEDLSGNDFAGLQGSTAWNFATVDLPPSATSLSPPDDAQGVPVDADLVIAFDQDVQKGSGDIVVKRSSDDSMVETITVSAAQVSVSERTATIDLNAALERRTAYYVEVAGGAFEDLNGNDFAGLSGATAWNFTTVGPLAVDDTIATDEDVPIEIPVLYNDLGSGQVLDSDTLALVAGSGPAHGLATIGNGLVTYSPAVNFVGTDSFRYTVRDVAGFLSGEATVTVTVAAVPDYQNRLFPEDVNHSGSVSPIDVLILINYINDAGSTLPPDPIPPDTPEFYYDVDGNGIVTPRDVLLIINYINARRPSGEGEAWTSENDAASDTDSASGSRGGSEPILQWPWRREAAAVGDRASLDDRAIVFRGWEADDDAWLDGVCPDDLLSVLARTGTS
jgi:hypothetical protein